MSLEVAGVDTVSNCLRIVKTLEIKELPFNITSSVAGVGAITGAKRRGVVITWPLDMYL